MVEFTKLLNKSQLEVVNTLDGAILVIAGAGSGKTRVIEYRVLNLILNKVAPQSILLLTFTRRASREMLSRASSHDVRCNYVEGGTFHSFAYKTLKKHSKLIGFDSFSILDEDDSQEAVALCARKAGLDTKDKRFPKKDTLRKIISMSINKGLPIDELLERDYSNFADYTQEIERVKNDYARFKLEKQYFDYDDMLVYMRLLLQKNPGLRAELARMYRYVMVDEYQDTNRLQADITCMIGQEHGNVMAVGDDAQSIYGFRGASHANIMEFPKRFAGCRVIKLEDNYRSHQKILDVANCVLGNMHTKFDKSLVSAGRLEGDKPALMYFRNSNEEASWVAQRILEMRDSGVDFGKQAVLFRSSYISIPLQLELSRRSIPFQMFGGMKVYETAHVKDLLAFLKVILNPRDEISWSRLLQLLEGIGPKTSERIVKSVSAYRNIGDIIQEALLRDSQDRKYSTEMKRLANALEKAAKETSCRRQFEAALEYYTPFFKVKFDDWPQREADLDALKQMSGGYDSLRDFLADFTIEPPEKGVAEVTPSASDDERPLTLSTIHSAKGLEWEAVYLIGLMDGVLPVSFSLSNDDSIEEEQRLFYVAVTRAKRHLFLSLHHEGSGFGLNQFNRPSRFIENREVLKMLETDVCMDSRTVDLDDIDIDI
ncbi:MAG: ATP-dependent helicase [Deltaproteobacteria bacterium]